MHSGEDVLPAGFRLLTLTKLLLLNEGHQIALIIVSSAEWRSLIRLRRLLLESERHHISTFRRRRYACSLSSNF